MSLLQFLGEVLRAAGALVRARPGFEARAWRAQLVFCGPDALPIVLLTCSLVGLMLAYMGGAQLERMGGQHLIAQVVSVGMVRELAGLMTAVILTGRVGAAFAAELASMQANEEIDALRALALDPVRFLVMPRLLALVLVGPVLVLFGMLAGVLAGLPPAVWVYGLSAAQYLALAHEAFTLTHFSIGLFKAVVYMVLIALAGCRQGLGAQRHARAVGQATTQAVVQSLIWIVAAACITTVVFTSLGY
jgi:phospholipid/cholesterol/gamma-HCH transport system permease protein